VHVRLGPHGLLPVHVQHQLRPLLELVVLREGLVGLEVHLVGEEPREDLVALGVRAAEGTAAALLQARHEGLLMILAALAGLR